MTARILVVDDVPSNVKLLEARLMSEYYHVLTADNGPAAISICKDGLCDMVLLDVMMPGMDGLEVCRLLKEDPATTHIPIVLVTSLDGQEDRVRGLEAGADDFLTKPVNDLELLTRVKSLTRLKMITDDLRMRAASGDELAIDHFQSLNELSQTLEGSRIAYVHDGEGMGEVDSMLSQTDFAIDVLNNPEDALIQISQNDYDLAIVSLQNEGADSLKLCSHIRSLEAIRTLPILLVADFGEERLVSRALDLGVNDYIRRPVDNDELRLRVKTLLRRKKYNDCLRNSVERTIEMAAKDPLTNLYNRRYFDTRARNIIDQNHGGSLVVSAVMIDIDHFKQINDTHGHDVGDEVIRDCASRIIEATRDSDVACRYGGEEFLVIMPGVSLDDASIVAERLRRTINSNPVQCRNGEVVSITVSVGVSTLEQEVDALQKLLKRADIALYDAKRGGRDQVVACVA